METYTDNQIQEQYQKLPAPLKNAMMSAEIAQKMFAIGRKFGLPVEKISLLAEETGFVILGFSSPQTFVAMTKEALEIDAEKAHEIAKEVNRQIFAPLREELKKTHNIEISDEDLQQGVKNGPPDNLTPTKPAPSAQPSAPKNPAGIGEFPKPASAPGEFPRSAVPPAASPTQKKEIIIPSAPPGIISPVDLRKDTKPQPPPLESQSRIPPINLRPAPTMQPPAAPTRPTTMIPPEPKIPQQPPPLPPKPIPQIPSEPVPATLPDKSKLDAVRENIFSKPSAIEPALSQSPKPTAPATPSPPPAIKTPAEQNTAPKEMPLEKKIPYGGKDPYREDA